MGPLTGVRVLALEGFISGPYGSMLLADFGAEVIKVEPPRGDTYRSSAPVVENDRGRMSYNFLRVNRNKHSVVLDLTLPEDRDAFLTMVETADVVWENLRTGALDRLDLGWETLRARNPRLVLASISGYGRDVLQSPYAGRPAFDLVAQALSGLMTRVGEAGQPPLYLGVPVADQVAGVFAAFGVTLALREAERTGTGQRVDVSMLDSMVALNEQTIGYYGHFGQEPKRGSSPTSAPYAAYRAADGWFVIGIASDRIFRQFCAAIDHPDLADDPTLQTGILRANQEVDALRPAIEEWAATRTREEACRELNAAGVPAAPVQSTADLFTDPHVAAREMIVEIDDPVFGPLRVAGNPIKLSRHPHTPAEPAPQLGADQDSYAPPPRVRP
jgi:formyl-CoA transferase